MKKITEDIKIEDLFTHKPKKFNSKEWLKAAKELREALRKERKIMKEEEDDDALVGVSAY